MTSSGQGKWRGKMSAAGCLSYLCLSENLADVWFTFKDDSDARLPAHRFILQMRSEVFEKMFSRAYQTSEVITDITVDDVSRDVMELLLRFLYTDELYLSPDNAFNILYAANKYMLDGLHEQCAKYLVNQVDAENVCDIYEKVKGYDLDNIVSLTCLEYIRRHAWKVFKTGKFLNITRDTLSAILDSDILTGKEIEIFKAVKKWAEHQCVLHEKQTTPENIQSFVGDTVYKVRFPLMSIEDFIEEVQPSGVLSDEHNLLLHQYISQKQEGDTLFEGKFSASPRNGGVLTEQIFNCYPNPTCVPGGCDQAYLMTIMTNEDIHLHSLKGPLIRYIEAIEIHKQRRVDVTCLTYDNRMLLLESRDIWVPIPYKSGCQENEEIVFTDDILLLPTDYTHIRIKLWRRLPGIEGRQISQAIATRPGKRARGARRQGAEPMVRVVRATNMSLIIQKTTVSLELIPPGINQISFR
ncbi:BTB/POZ domain-containing protein 2-like isoform X1 [Ruditapes philippinarum]|uniref:BTB/POZ domain-containing protein 2-like isoform X1 n=1 Tax=Ruditapes philippinarum TaxID=129788 RepID=UPI00295AB4BB|nr:BTB/POZ domain-containing protein 2-like isoform X1 [Ruditapes philippinarum]